MHDVEGPQGGGVALLLLLFPMLLWCCTAWPRVVMSVVVMQLPDSNAAQWVRPPTDDEVSHARRQVGASGQH